MEVGDADFDGVELVENVEFGEIETVVDLLVWLVIILPEMGLIIAQTHHV